MFRNYPDQLKKVITPGQGNSQLKYPKQIHINFLLRVPMQKEV